MTERTLADLLALPAGRELDAEVARLQGWKWGTVSREIPPTPGLEVWRTGEGKDFTVHAYVEAYRPSQDVLYAWPLLAEMLAAGATITLAVWDGRMQLDYDFVSSGDLVNVPTLADASLAIVRAWATWMYGKRGDG